MKLHWSFIFLRKVKISNTESLFCFIEAFRGPGRTSWQFVACCCKYEICCNISPSISSWTDVHAWEIDGEGFYSVINIWSSVEGGSTSFSVDKSTVSRGLKNTCIFNFSLSSVEDNGLFVKSSLSLLVSTETLKSIRSDIFVHFYLQNVQSLW